MTTEQLYKQMDAGKLLSKDVLPKVGKAMADAARKGGALDKQIASLAAGQARFNTQMQLLKESLGQSGFSQIATTTFRLLGDVIKNNLPTLKIFAATLNLAFQTALLPIKLFVGALSDINNLLPKTVSNLGHMAVNLMYTASAIWLAVRAWRALGFAKGASGGGGLKGAAGKAAGIGKNVKGIASTGAKGLGVGVIAGAIAQPFMGMLSDKFPKNEMQKMSLEQTKEYLKANNTVSVDINLKSDMLEAKVHQIFGDAVNPNVQQ